MKEKRVLVLSDIHFPYQEKSLVAAALDFAKQEKFDELVLNGDIIDFFPISRHDKNPERRNDLLGECAATTEFIFDARKVMGTRPIIFAEGNHEMRLKKYVWRNCPELMAIPGLNVQSLLSLERAKVRYTNRMLRYGQLVVAHGDGVAYGARAGYSVTGWMNRLFSSILIGHVHRQGIIHKRTYRGEYLVGVENGCMCMIEGDWIRDWAIFPDWQQGFSYFTVHRNETVTPRLVRWENRRLAF